MLIEVLMYDPVVFVNRPLLGHDKATANWPTNFVPEFTKKRSGGDVYDESTMVTRAVQERQHAYIQDLYFWQFVASIDGYGSVDVCIWLMRSPTFVCEFLQVQSCSYNLPIKLSSENVLIGIHQKNNPLA
jgi:hypothetical protein